jgi:transcriptional regulator with XRE-family HTH domain
MELKLSQKDVAAKINEKPSVLQDYESSKAIPNPQILGKLERALGVKLRGTFLLLPNSRVPVLTCPAGADIGKKLEAKKSST